MNNLFKLTLIIIYFCLKKKISLEKYLFKCKNLKNRDLFILIYPILIVIHPHFKDNLR